MTADALVERAEKFSRKSHFSDSQIEDVAKGDKPAIAKWVRKTASDGWIAPKTRGLARSISRLSDGVVDLDGVEEMLVAMNRAGVISSYQRGLLQVRYLR